MSMASERPKRVAMLQSCYIPWKGYFDLINSVDEFILYDDVPYDKNGWRNRNRIKSGAGAVWLTIPVHTKGRFGQPIQEVEISDRRWAARHWKSIATQYAQARHFRTVGPALHALYERATDEPFLTRVNELFTRALCALLGIGARITRSTDYELRTGRTERLVHLCEQVGAREYLSGPAARAYLDEGLFAERGIAVRWMDYSGYPEYTQLFVPPFIHEVSVVDLLLNEGAEAAGRYMLSAPRGVPAPTARDHPVSTGPGCLSPS